jgi:hypothetical protein
MTREGLSLILSGRLSKVSLTRSLKMRELLIKTKIWRKKGKMLFNQAKMILVFGKSE